MYIESVPNRNSPPAILLRRSFRKGDKVVKETIANLTKWPPHVIEGLKALLESKPIQEDPKDGSKHPNGFEIIRSYAHGHVKACLGIIKNIELDKIISSTQDRELNLIIGMIVSRIISASSKLATARDLSGTTCSNSLGVELNLGDVCVDELYDALDWLEKRQERIQNKLINKHLDDTLILLYDVSSSYFEGDSCALAKYGYSRDSRPDRKQIVYGLLCNQYGCPMAVEVFEGNTADPSTFSDQVKKLRAKYPKKKLIWVGDRGMITSARIKEDLVVQDFTQTQTLDWISALRSEQIRSLFEDGTLCLSDFQHTDIKEVSSSSFPNERLVACKNEALCKERGAHREALLVATEAELEKIAKRSILGKDKIGLAVGKVLHKHKMAKHFLLEISNSSFSYKRNQSSIQAEQNLDGFYVIRSSLSKEIIARDSLVLAYKNLSRVEFAFRTMKSDDLQIRPIFHYKDSRVKAHVFLCMLTYYLEWHMRKKLAAVLFDDEDKVLAAQERRSVVAPAIVSTSAKKKAASKISPVDNLPIHSFSSLIRDLGSIVLNEILPTFPGALPFMKSTIPTPLQLKVFALLGI